MYFTYKNVNLKLNIFIKNYIYNFKINKFVILFINNNKKLK